MSQTKKDQKKSQADKSDRPASLVGRDLLTLKLFTKDEIESLLWTAKDLKTRIRDRKETFQPLVGKSAALIFEKRSTRTRISTETGLAALGGSPLFLSSDDIHLGVNESLEDTSRVLARFCDLIVARVYEQSTLDGLASGADIPVISGLSDIYHPLQTLADLLTLQEHFGRLSGLKMAWVGDGNNIIHSLMMGCTRLGVDLHIATPKDYPCSPEVVEDAMKFASEFGTTIQFTSDPLVAVEGADVVVTDTWISMGQEEEKAKRLKDFAGYQVTRKMLSKAHPNWVFLHCLPRKPQEVDDDVFYDKDRSLVWDEAENRKWTVMSVMLHTLMDHAPVIPRPTF